VSVLLLAVTEAGQAIVSDSLVIPVVDSRHCCVVGSNRVGCVLSWGLGRRPLLRQPVLTNLHVCWTSRKNHQMTK